MHPANPWSQYNAQDIELYYNNKAVNEAGRVGVRPEGQKDSLLLSQSKLGLGLTVFIAIKTNQHNAAWSSQFRRVVEQLPGILEVHRLGGDIDYLVKAVVPDMPGYDALYQQLIRADLFDVSASFVMETMKHTTELPL